MAHSSELIAENIEEYLTSHQYKSLLRFITCGSVDDGKSTLIGRLLYETHLVFEDHLAALEADSAKVGTQGGDLDFALLSMGCRPSANRASRSTSRTGSSPPSTASSSLPTPPVTSSTPATW